jgi:hypothetical protein
MGPGQLFYLRLPAFGLSYGLVLEDINFGAANSDLGFLSVFFVSFKYFYI